MKKKKTSLGMNSFNSTMRPATATKGFDKTTPRIRHPTPRSTVAAAYNININSTFKGKKASVPINRSGFSTARSTSTTNRMMKSPVNRNVNKFGIKTA